MKNFVIVFANLVTISLIPFLILPYLLVKNFRENRLGRVYTGFIVSDFFKEKDDSILYVFKEAALVED